jgi:hypothetical protein
MAPIYRKLVHNKLGNISMTYALTILVLSFKFASRVSIREWLTFGAVLGIV